MAHQHLLLVNHRCMDIIKFHQTRQKHVFVCIHQCIPLAWKVHGRWDLSHYPGSHPWLGRCFLNFQKRGCTVEVLGPGAHDCKVFPCSPRIHEGSNAGRNSVTWNGSMKSSLLPEGSWKVFATRLGFLSIECMLYHIIWHYGETVPGVCINPQHWWYHIAWKDT